MKSEGRGGDFSLFRGKMFALEANAFLKSEPQSPGTADQGISREKR